MSNLKVKNVRKQISLLLVVMILFSMCSAGIPAAADEIPLYYYNDSNDIKELPAPYINGIMIAHYFNIMGAYDSEGNFKPNEPMKSSDLEYSLKAIDKADTQMINFEGELLTVQALVQRIWLGAGKGSYMYSAETQESYLYEYSLGISYDENNDFANAWTFCVKNGIVTQFFDRQDFSVNLPVTRAMAAYALSNYYLWHNEGYDINNLTLDIPGVGQIDEAEMNNTATATDADGKLCYIGKAYDIGDYDFNGQNYDEIFVKIKNKYEIYAINMGLSIFKSGRLKVKLPDYEKLMHNPMPAKRAPKDVILAPTVYFDLDGDGEFDDYTATAIDVKPEIIKGDINGTGDLDIADCLAIQKHLTGSVMLDGTRLQLADIDDNEEVNLLDAYLLWEQTSSQAAAQPKQATASALAYIKRTEAEQTQNTATTFKFMSDGAEILNSVTLDGNTHYLKLPKNTHEKSGYSFNCWSLYRLDENGNKLYHCTTPNIISATATDATPTDATATDTNAQSTTTPVMWLANPTGEYAITVFKDESLIYNIPTGEFSELYLEANWISYNNFKYRVISDGTAEITKYKGNDTYVTIPSVINGYTVTSVGNYAFYNCTSLTSITIPESVTSIGDYAFYKCTRLTNITIPDSVTSIGSCAFGWCSSLTSITIPDSVTSIYSCAFEGCTSLASITMPDSVTSIGNGAFYNCTSLASITIPDSVTWTGSEAFYNTAWYENQPYGDVYAGKVYYKYKGKMPRNHTVNIREGTVGIAGGAFCDCRSLTSITIPNSVTSIGDYAFCYCTSLKSITIPDSVTSIGDRTFYNCTSLTSITIPEGVTSIGWHAFAYCRNLTSITIPEGVTSIGDEAFRNCTSLASITIPDSVTSIGCMAFYNTAWYNNQPDGDVYAGKVYYKYKGIMPNNHTVNIREGTVDITDDAFLDCTSLASVTIPEGVTSIGNYAFMNCTSLTSITIPEGVKSIEDGAFSGCTSLTSITIPEGVKSIGRSAFSGCTSLTSITIPDSVTSIGEYAFDNCPNLNISCTANSYAETYAIENNIPYTLITETP